MDSPYSLDMGIAFNAAEVALAGTVTAVAWHNSARSWWSRSLITLAAASAGSVLIVPPKLAPLLKLDEQDLFHRQLVFSAVVMVVAMLAKQGRRVMLPAAALLAAALYYGDPFFRLFHDQDYEVAALYMFSIGVLVGIDRLILETPPALRAPPPPRPGWWVDLALGALGMATAAGVSSVVLHRQMTSADEWSYTFAAATFAKLRASADYFPCNDVFQNFWIFPKSGKLISQYLPGWPVMIAPWLRLGAGWLAGPFAFGLLVAGCGRVSRRAVSALVSPDDPTRARRLTMAAAVAAVSLCLSSTALLNGASRFVHIWVAALFVWAVEAVAASTEEGGERRRSWAIALGVILAWLLASRHSDGLCLGVGLFLYVVYALVRRRVPLGVTVAGATSFAAVGLFFLVILRLQLGHWFATGYSYTAQVHDWVKTGFSWPTPNAYKWSVPLAIGSYGWWPVSPALGVAGLIALFRSRERRLSFMLGVSCVVCLCFYIACELGRDGNPGYGPRFQIIQMVPMTIGSAIMLEPLLSGAMAWPKRLRAWQPVALSLILAVCVLGGAMTISPTVYPAATREVVERNRVNDLIKKNGLTNAVVWVPHDLGPSPWLDLTQNLPYGLYPNDVLIGFARDGEASTKCVENAFPTRQHFSVTTDHDVVELKAK